MSPIPFIKMHGAENDYIFFDGLSGPLPQDPGKLALDLCRRHAAIGGDGIICLQPSTDPACDVVMQVWNADGSPARMCGTAARCTAVWMKRQQRVTETCRIRIDDRIVTATEIRTEPGHQSAAVDMGPARLLFHAEGKILLLNDSSSVVTHSVEVGNPHAVIFVDALSDELVHTVGPQIEHHPALAERTNVEFVAALEDGALQVRVWERGSGETRSCGSGACAVAAAAWHAGRLADGHSCVVHMPGGVLHVERQSDGHLQLSGPVRVVCTGQVTDPEC